MNPNYYRSASPQPQSAGASSQRDHSTRTMYQNPYGAAHDMQLRSLQMGSPFGFAGHPHPGGGPFYQTAPGNYHIVSPDMNPNTGREVQQQRPVSPSSTRRRPSIMTDFHHGDRERYLRTISPTENRSPSGSNSQRHIQRAPSPRGSHHGSNNIGHGASGGRYEGGGASGGRYEGTGVLTGRYDGSLGGRADSSTSSHDRQGGPAKKARLGESSHFEASVQDAYSRAGGMLKQETRTQQLDYVSRPMPLEAISPPANDETNEVDRMLLQVQDDIRTMTTNMSEAEATQHQLEVELKSAETRKEEYDKAQRSHAELAQPDSPEADVTGDVARRIIFENRKISEAEHRSAAKKLQMIVPIPAVVSNPMDLSDVMQVLRDYHKQRPGIILRLKKDRQAKQIRERYLKERYKQLSQAYVSRMEKIENNPKKKNRETKMRDYYERQFPEIKKIREDKIRDGRSGSRIKGDEADGAGSSLNGTEESEMEKYHRNAVLVPMLLDAKDRSRHFYDRNRLVENCANEYKLSITNCFWTQEEKDIFKEKYLQRPKDFGFICSFLKRKTVQDCVQHYYLTKRKEMYKQMIKKQKAYRIRRGPNKRLQSTDDPISPTKLSVSMANSLTASGMRLASISEGRNDFEDIRAIALTIVCPAKKCHARRRVIKRLFKAPHDFPNFSVACRQLELPETAVSCCKYCVSYLEKRLGLKKWSSLEIDALKKGLLTHGANWNLVSKCITTKRLRDCMQYYRRHSAELGLAAGDVLPLSLPPIADDEYSPFSASSASDDEAPINGHNHIPGEVVKRTETVVMVRTVSEDSNATLSADEVEDEPEPPIPRFMTNMPRPSGTQSFTPNQLPTCETSRSRMTSPYALSPAESRLGANNGPACVRDLIHSAIEKNLDKDRQNMQPHHVPDDFRRRLDATVSNIGRQNERSNSYQDSRRGEIDVAVVSRLMDEGQRSMNLLNPKGMPSRDPKSPNRQEGAPPAGSPSRRDLSPQNPDDRNRLNSLRSPTGPQQQPPQSYQYSTRQNLLTDFNTSRQIQAEQHAGDSRQFDGPSSLQQPDPRYMQFYSPYVYLPQGYAHMQLTPEYMESLAAAGYAPQMAVPNVSSGNNTASGQARVPIPIPQRSIILGTGRPGMAEEQLSSGAGGDRGESANRLQTLAANRGILRETSGDKRKPDVITIDDTRREGGQSPAQTDMRFHPASSSHHLMKTENVDREPNPNLTAGSLIDVIITRQISNPARGDSATPTGPPVVRPSLLPKREMPEMAGHKPFTLGEHIEQIIASDFSRKEALGAPGGVAMNMGGGGGVGLNLASGYQQFAARMDEGNWKRNRLRMEEQQAAPPSTSYTKQTALPVVYEPISPAASRDPSDSGGDEDEDNNRKKDGPPGGVVNDK